MVPQAIISGTDYSLNLLKRSLDEHAGRVPSRTVLRQIVGDDLPEVVTWLQGLERRFGDATSANEAIDAVLQSRASFQKPEELFDLILSGPEIAEVPTCETITTIHDLIHSARKELLICDYAIYGAGSIFTHLASAKEQNPGLRIRMVLHVFEDNQGKQNRLERFATELLRKHWKSMLPPEVYIDPRNIHDDYGLRTSMHAKCFIADQDRALVTSANLTDAAHHKNIEVGVVVRYGGFVQRLIRYFDALIDDDYLQKIEFTDSV